MANMTRWVRPLLWSSSLLVEQSAQRSYATMARKKAKTLKQIREEADAVPIVDAVRILQAFGAGNPQYQIELYVKCRTDKQHPIVRGSVKLAKGLKQEATILVFAEGQAAVDAKAAGADIVGGPELVDRVQAGEFTFDKCLSTPAMLPSVAKIARYLGPKGLMPSVKKGTATNDLASLVTSSKQSFDYRSDKHGVVRSGIARLNFQDQEVEDNIKILVEDIKLQAPVGKRDFVEKVHISATRGPGLMLQPFW